MLDFAIICFLEQQCNMILYAAKRCKKWLQGIEANSTYVYGACAPTMGSRHIYNEYKSIWGDEQKFFEPLTFSNYLKTIFEEYRWGDRKCMEIKIVPMEK